MFDTAFDYVLDGNHNSGYTDLHYWPFGEEDSISQLADDLLRARLERISEDPAVAAVDIDALTRMTAKAPGKRWHKLGLLDTVEPAPPGEIPLVEQSKNAWDAYLHLAGAGDWLCTVDEQTTWKLTSMVQLVGLGDVEGYSEEGDANLETAVDVALPTNTGLDALVVRYLVNALAGMVKNSHPQDWDTHGDEVISEAETRDGRTVDPEIAERAGDWVKQEQLFETFTASAAFLEEKATMDSEPVCFAAGTPILMADGSSKPIEEIQPGDLVFAASDQDPEGPVEAKEVVEIYHNRPDSLIELSIGEQTIRCTPRHPFYAKQKGWTAAAELETGDELRTHDGGWVKLEAKLDKGEVEPVFNLEVGEFHTYFVGKRSWGFSLLVHNAPCRGDASSMPFADQKLHEFFIGKLNGLLRDAVSRRLQITGKEDKLRAGELTFYNVRESIDRVWINRKENKDLSQLDLVLGRKMPAASESQFVYDLTRSMNRNRLLYKSAKGLEFIKEEHRAITLAPLMHLTQSHERGISIGTDKFDHFITDGLLLYDVYRDIREEGITKHGMKPKRAEVRARWYAKSLACWLEGGLPADLPKGMDQEVFAWLTNGKTRIKYNYCGVAIETPPSIAYGVFADRSLTTPPELIDPNGFASPADVHASLAGLDFYLWLSEDINAFDWNTSEKDAFGGNKHRYMTIHSVEAYVTHFRTRLERMMLEFWKTGKTTGTLPLFSFYDDTWDQNVWPNQLKKLPVPPGMSVYPKKLADVPRIKLGR